MKGLKKSSCFWIIFSFYLILGYLLSTLPIAASEPVEFGLKWDANNDGKIDGTFNDVNYNGLEDSYDSDCDGVAKFVYAVSQTNTGATNAANTTNTVIKI